MLRPPWQARFAPQQSSGLAETQQCKLIILYIPDLAEVRDGAIREEGPRPGIFRRRFDAGRNSAPANVPRVIG